MKPDKAASPARFSNSDSRRGGLGALRQGASGRDIQWRRLEFTNLLGLRGLWRKLRAPLRQPTRRIVLDSQAHSLQDLADTLSADKASEFVRCEVVIPNDWVAWASIPWMGPKLHEVERSAVVRQRLDALYGPSTDRHVALSGTRFGWGQWVAATSGARIARVKALLNAHGIAKARLVPAQVVAWRSYVRLYKKSGTPVAPGARGYQDQLFATVDGVTMTVSWQRFTLPLDTQADMRLGPALGIRNLALPWALSLADDQGGFVADGKTDTKASVSELVRSLQREILLQRLDMPQVVVVVRDGRSGAQGNVQSGAGWRAWTLDACPHDWTLLQTQDWHSLEVLRALHPDNAKGVQVAQAPKTEQSPNWMLKPDLDFSRPSGVVVVKPAWPSWAMGAAVVCAILSGLLYQHQSDRLQQLREEMEQATNEKLVEAAKGRAQDRMTSPQNAMERAALQQREQVRASLAVPWESLFQCIESAVGVVADKSTGKGALATVRPGSPESAGSTMGAEVTLSQVQPDPNSGDVIIAGDARNYKAISALVMRLEENANVDGSEAMGAPSKRFLGGVCRDLHLPYISSFQVNEQDPQRTVRFEIHANWIRPSLQRSAPGALAGQAKAPLASGAAVAAGVRQ